MTIPQALQIALQHHQAGRLANADALYRQILAVQPNHADALHLLGLLVHQAGRHQSAADLIRQAIAVNPANADYYINLGNALVAQGHLDEAITTYGRALQSKPYFAMAHNNLGATLKARGRLDDAIVTFPYNGHTTSLDSLWMGVPVVSLAGETPVSRAGLSQLTNLGLPELAAHSEEDYVRIAVELAGDLPRLAQLRDTLRDRMEHSVLMDASRFATSIEAAYRAMWKAWSHGQSPAQE